MLTLCNFCISIEINLFLLEQLARNFSWLIVTCIVSSKITSIDPESVAIRRSYSIAFIFLVIIIVIISIEYNYCITVEMSLYIINILIMHWKVSFCCHMTRSRRNPPSMIYVTLLILVQFNMTRFKMCKPTLFISFSHACFGEECQRIGR